MLTAVGVRESSNRLLPAPICRAGKRAVSLFAPEGNVTAYYKLLEASAVGTDPVTVYFTVGSN